MPFVGELYFDPSTEKRIRDAWKALDEKGISDSMPKGGYRPHVSLGVCDHLEAVTVCRQIDLPVSTDVKEMGLVKVLPTGCQTLRVYNLKS